jgi:propionyl-CoA carboxylase alpha chain
LSGDLSTAFIGQQFPDGFKGHNLTQLQRTQLLAAAAVLRVLDQQRAATISGRLSGAVAPADAYDREVLISLGKSSPSVAVAVESTEKPSKVTKHMAAGVASPFNVVIDGVSHSVSAALPGSSTIYRCAVDGSDVVLQLLSTDALGYTLQFVGSPFHVQVMNATQEKLQAYMPAKKVADTSKSLVTPMPGLVANLLVKVGDIIAPGQPLAVIEAMKMQNMLSVGKAFVVKAIHVKQGENVALDDTLITFDDIKQ